VTLMVVPEDPTQLDALKSAYRKHIRDAASRSVANRFAGSDGQPGSLLDRVKARFDRNGDGRLDEEERAAARKFYRGNRF